MGMQARRHTQHGHRYWTEDWAETHTSNKKPQAWLEDKDISAGGQLYPFEPSLRDIAYALSIAFFNPVLSFMSPWVQFYKQWNTASYEDRTFVATAHPVSPSEPFTPVWLTVVRVEIWGVTCCILPIPACWMWTVEFWTTLVTLTKCRFLGFFFRWLRSSLLLRQRHPKHSTKHYHRIMGLARQIPPFIKLRLLLKLVRNP